MSTTNKVIRKKNENETGRIYTNKTEKRCTRYLAILWNRNIFVRPLFGQFELELSEPLVREKVFKWCSSKNGTFYRFYIYYGLNWTVPLRSSSIVILMIFSTAMIFTLPTCAPYIYTYCAKTITFHNELKSKKSSNLGKCDQTKTRIFFYFRSNFAKKKYNFSISSPMMSTSNPSSSILTYIFRFYIADTEIYEQRRRAEFSCQWNRRLK